MEILYTKKDIDFQVKILANQLNIKHKNLKSNTVFICVLDGGYHFFSDIVKLLDFDIQLDFMRVKSYEGKRKQGDLKIIKDIHHSIEGKHVYLVDDFLDSGTTIHKLVEYVHIKNPNTINILTFLKRKNCKYNPIHDKLVDGFYYGKELEGDDWLVGYGMDDDNGYKRNQTDIWKI
jgi:hypoxanthine phosphoribosyltransferase|tara:strand:- start:2472 stop:2999 length:528 start_codon:yes stop_codon:yes gene_type:complete